MLLEKIKAKLVIKKAPLLHSLNVNMHIFGQTGSVFGRLKTDLETMSSVSPVSEQLTLERNRLSRDSFSLYRQPGKLIAKSLTRYLIQSSKKTPCLEMFHGIKCASHGRCLKDCFFDSLCHQTDNVTKFSDDYHRYLVGHMTKR